MARTIHHMPYDVQVRAAWGDTDPAKWIDPLTGQEWESRFFKGARADRVAKGAGVLEHVPGARIGGSNPSAHREFLGRPRHLPTVEEFLSDDEAEAAYDAEQRYLDELSNDLRIDAESDPWEDYEEIDCPTCGGPCRI